MIAKAIPSQEECDPENPEEHFLWALRNMPTFAGVGAVTHSGFLRQWSSHLVKCGAVHVDYLRGLADENGNINVSQLPKQEIKFQEAFRGPRHQFNNAGRWVGKDAPDPQPVRLQDVRSLTDQERQAMAEQLIAVGAIKPEKPPQHSAQALNEGN